MKFEELQTQNSLQHICLYWGIPSELCRSIQVFRLSSRPALPASLTVFKNSKHSVSIAWNVRIIQYTSGACLLIPDLSFGKFDYYIYSDHEFDFNEIGKLCILSAIGITKEIEGFSRLHAGCFLEGQNHCAVFGRPGSGKSTFFSNLLKSGDRVFADELCFLKSNRIFPIPLHIHLKPHQLIPLQTERPVHQSEGFTLSSIYFLQRSNQPTHAVSLSILEKITNFILLVAGDGLHQMAAYHLRIRYVGHWIRTIIRRSIVFVNLLRQSRSQKLLVQDLNYLARS